MTPVPPFVIIINAIFFIVYGLQCFTSEFMAAEFKRFGLNAFQRRATGTLQILGATGLFAGFYIPLLGFLSALGLALMMLIAFIVRIKIKDGFLPSAPSLIFLALNGWIAAHLYFSALF